MEAGTWREAQPASHFLAHHQGGGCAVGQRGGVARCDHPADLGEARSDGLVIERRLEAGQAVDGRVTSDGLVAVVRGCRTVLRGDLDEDDLVVESARIGRGCGTLVGPRGEFIEFRPVELPAGGDDLGGNALVDQAVGVAPGQRAVGATAPGGQAHRHPAHRLSTACDGDVISARDDPLGGEVQGLLRGSALPVHAGGGDRLGETGGQHRCAADVGRLIADLADASGYHVVDERRVEPGALDEGSQRRTEQVHRVDA